HVTLLAGTQSLAELTDASEFIVARHPGVRELAAVGFDHSQSNSPGFLILHPARHVALGPPLLVFGPLLGQIQPTIQGTMPTRGGVTEKDADLAVLHLSQVAAPLARHAAGILALFGKAAAIHDQNR